MRPLLDRNTQDGPPCHRRDKPEQHMIVQEGVKEVYEFLVAFKLIIELAFHPSNNPSR